jgi:hypothetical protein
MNEKQVSREPQIVQIKVQGRLDVSWSDWFEGMAISCDQDDSTLTGRIVDQVALRTILNRLWDLNLTLLSVNLIVTAPEKR